MKTSKISLITFIIILIIGGLFYFYSKDRKVSESANLNQVSQQGTPNSVKQIDKGEKMGMLNEGIYKSEKFGFQFKVPADWKIVSDSNNSGVEWYAYLQSPDYKYSPKNGDEVSIQILSGYELSIYVQSPALGMKGVNDILEFNKLGRGGPSYKNEQVVKLGGLDAVTYDINWFEGPQAYEVSFLYKGDWIRVNLAYKKGTDGKKIFDQVLSSMKFD